MKTKTFKKKLTLNKKTIADLTSGKLSHVKGGLLKTDPPCLVRITEETCPVTGCGNTCFSEGLEYICCSGTCAWTCSGCGTVCGGPAC